MQKNKAAIPALNFTILFSSKSPIFNCNRLKSPFQMEVMNIVSYTTPKACDVRHIYSGTKSVFYCSGHLDIV